MDYKGPMGDDDIKNEVLKIVKQTHEKINFIHQASLRKMITLNGLFKASSRGRIDYKSSLFMKCQSKNCAYKLAGDYLSWFQFAKSFNQNVNFIDFKSNKIKSNFLKTDFTPAVTLAILQSAQKILQPGIDENKSYSLGDLLGEGFEDSGRFISSVSMAMTALPVLVGESFFHAFQAIANLKFYKLKIGFRTIDLPWFKTLSSRLEKSIKKENDNRELPLFYTEGFFPKNNKVTKRRVGQRIAKRKGKRLLKALEEWKMKKVRRLIRRGADLNMQTYYGKTALMFASLNGLTDIAKELIAAGAKLNLQSEDDYYDREGWSALMFAAVNGHTDIAKALIAANADMNLQNDNGETALMWASRKGHTDIAKALIAAGAYMNLQDEGYYGSTALIEASRNAYTDIVKALIAADADLNLKDKNEKTALMYASKRGHTDIAKALIAADADLNIQDEGYYGSTALMNASGEGRTDIAKALIAAGAELNLKDNYRRTALIEASERGHTDIVKALIAADADLNLQDKDGKTALMKATGNGRTDIAKALIAADADLNLKTKNGLTALIWASTYGYTDIVNLFKKAGAQQ